MKKLATGSLFLLTLASCAPQKAPGIAAAQETDFQQLIAGRTPGPAQSCVQQRLLQGNKSYGEGVIAFEGTTGVVYVNHPSGGCPELSSTRALRTRTTSDQLCRNDIISVFEPTTGIEVGSCALGEFVPYRRG